MECCGWSYDEAVFMAPTNHLDFRAVLDEINVVKEEERLMPVAQERVFEKGSLGKMPMDPGTPGRALPGGIKTTNVRMLPLARIKRSRFAVQGAKLS